MTAGRGTYKHLLALAVKKPAVKEALDSVDNLTYDEIDKLLHLQMWIRKRLKQAKAINEANRSAAILMKNAVDVIAEYDVYQFKGESCDHRIGNKLSIEIEHGDLIVVIQPGKIKLNATVIDLSTQEIEDLISTSTFLRKTTIPTYNSEILQPYLEDKYGNDVAIMGSTVATAGLSSVRIY